jgi:predicted membrane channel-forming protein YqfA (hemolysin III family)
MYTPLTGIALLIAGTYTPIFAIGYDIAQHITTCAVTTMSP